jgi:hypothetical protein
MFPRSTKTRPRHGVFGGARTWSTTKAWAKRVQKVRTRGYKGIDLTYGERKLTARLSLVCCIYHKARPVGESSSESDSSSSDSDQSTGDAGSRRNCHHIHHNHRVGAQESPERGRAGSGHSHDSRKTKRRKPSPNAYEKMPKNTKG